MPLLFDVFNEVSFSYSESISIIFQLDGETVDNYDEMRCAVSVPSLLDDNVSRVYHFWSTYVERQLSLDMSLEERLDRPKG